MISCPKCGSFRISGPTYRGRTHDYLREALVYRCETCGYSERRPTRDAEDEERSFAR